MATLLWRRDISSDINGVEQTYSSWDSCMSKAYCKWPAIIGIIVGVLIVLSIVSCLARCLCCGLECCCGICSCCNACCPSPRRRRRRNDDGYYPAPAPPPSQHAYQPPQQYPQHPQYQSPAPPSYSQPGSYKSPVPQTATYNTQTKGVTGQKINEDALPAMPTWGSATEKHVLEEDEVEMDKLDHTGGQAQHLLPQNDNRNDNFRSYGHHDTSTGDLGAMSANPYHDYEQHQQFVASPISSTHNSMYPPTYHTSPTSTMYEPAQQQQHWAGAYAPSIAPSYHTQAPSFGNPAPQQQGDIVVRKPVQGTWREV